MASSVMPPNTIDSSTRCWELAVKIFNTTLTSDPKKIIYASQANTLYSCSSYAGVLEAATKSIQDGNEHKSNFCKTMKSSLLIFDRYASSIDVLVQHQPHVTALVWGSIRTLIQVAVKQMTTSATIAYVVGKIVQEIGRWDRYLRIFSNSDRIPTIAARLFSQIINYLVRATTFYTTPLTKQYLKVAATTAPSKLQDIWTEIEALSTQLERETNLAAEEDRKTSKEDFKAHASAVEVEVVRQENYRADSLTSIKALKSAQEKILRGAYELKLADETRDTADGLRRKNIQLSGDKNRIMAWLHKARDYNTYCKPWEIGTAEWILRHAVYTDWEMNRNGRALWIYGIPGSGKSVLAAYLAQSSHTQIKIAHFLQAAIDDSSTKIVSVAASILVQLLNDLSISSHSHALSTLITNTLPLLEHFSSHVTCPFDKLWAVVEGVYDHIPSFTVIIDALDECFATEDASSLVSKLMHMSSLPQARVIILSRHHTSLQTPLSECAQIEMDESMIANDITLFNDREVNRTPQIRVPVNEIIERATTGARGMFLWAKLMLEYVKHGSTLNNQRTRLQKFPVELTNVYDQMLSEAGAKLESEQLLDRRRIFMLLVAATSPLSVVEITVALALDTVDMHPHKDDLLIDPMERIGKLCWPFTKTIEGRVQFVHYSMQEYLVTEDCRTVSASSRDPATFLRFSSQECNDYIALKCMFRLINAEARSINTIEPLLRKRIEDHDLAVSSNGLPSDWPLYSYATRNWYIHVVKSANSFALLQHVSIFLNGLEFITWVEEYHTENCDMGAVVEVQATLSSWHAGLSEKQRQEVHICQFMERPFKDFCALESVFRKTPEITYMAMHRLGLYENTSGTGTNTLKLCAAVAEGFSTTLGHLHTLTLRCITRWCIERIIAPVRELPAGEALLIETMSLQLQILGASHPDSYYTQQIAGLAMYYRAHFHSALYHLRHSCDGLLRTLGPNHEYYQHSRLYYAHVLTGLGRFEEAACIYREIWRHWARLHGSQHPLCSMAQCNLGLMYRKLGRFLPAEEHLMEALAQRQRMFHKHEVIIDSYIQIALLRRDQQDIDAATAYLDLAEAELGGMGFERYAQVQHLRALLLLDSGDRVDARRVLAALLAKGAAHPSNRNILWARLSLADLLRDCGHQGKALSLFMNLVEGIGEGKKKGNSGDVKAYLQVAEKALRMARHQGSEAADAELDRHNLRWRSPEAIWIIFGGPAAEVY